MADWWLRHRLLDWLRGGMRCDCCAAPLEDVAVPRPTSNYTGQDVTHALHADRIGQKFGGLLVTKDKGSYPNPGVRVRCIGGWEGMKFEDHVLQGRIKDFVLHAARVESWSTQRLP